MASVSRSIVDEFETSYEVAKFCRRWNVTELALFGSALRSDFSAESDIDLLVSFAGDANVSLLDHVRMQNELESLLGRKIDLFTRRAVESSHNESRRNDILKSAYVVF